MTNEIKKLSYHRDYLEKKSVKLNSHYYQAAYKKCRNQLNRHIKDTKARYYSSKLENIKSSKESWKTINELLNKRSKATIRNELQNGNTITGDKNLANEFNNYFSTIDSHLADNIPKNDFSPLSCVTPVSNVFSFKVISREELSDVIQKMKVSKSPGIDRIDRIPIFQI